MPPKRSAIGRLTNQAKRKREERASETSEQRQERQERNRVHTSLARKFLTEGKKYNSGHDESEVSNSSEKDICDCLTEECPGCHFPCPKCRSCKCGADCRVSRKWTYDIIENEGEVGNTKTEPTTDCCIFYS